MELHMRALLLFITFCIACPAFAANELADCARIDSAVERLDCYDRLARDKASEAQSEQHPGERQTAEADKPKRAPEAPVKREHEQVEPASKLTPSRPLVKGASRLDKNAESKIEWFGKSKLPDPAADLSHIEAHIENIRKSPLGHHVMTLSNGQVWMENEPGRRSIEPGQEVTIRKHRWHFEMELDNRPNVAVKRVD